MAKIKLGGLAGSISGSIGGTTFSHGRYGYYARQRSKPVVHDNDFTSFQRFLFGTLSKFWSETPEDYRATWATWAETHPVVDVLGDRQVLTGKQAWMMVACAKARADGDPFALPSSKPAPGGLTSLSSTWDVSMNNLLIDFAPSPMDPVLEPWCWVACVYSPGIMVARGMFRRVHGGDAGSSSPLNIAGDVWQRWGGLFPGVKVFVSCGVVDNESGLHSAPLLISGVLHV